MISYSQIAGYTLGKQVAVQHSQVSGTSNLINFPLLVSFTDNDLKTMGNEGNVENVNGYDIIFTIGDCTTQLDHEIESYNETTGQYIAWVRIPSLPATTDFEIHMYYGNSSVVIDPSTTNTWNVNYNGVWHFHDDFLDATSNSNTLTNNGSTNVVGFIGNAQDYDGDDYLDVDSPTVPIGNSSYTIEAWFNADLFGDRGIIGWGQYGAANRVNAIRILGNSGGLSHYWWSNDLNYTTEYMTNTWNYVVVNFDGTTRRIYLNGTQIASDTPGGAHNTTNANFRIGSTNFTEYFDGTIDEVKISNTARSADWIATEYNNQISPSTFYNVSDEMAASTLCSVLPVELLYFNISQENKTVSLNWSTASEINNDYFTIERSENGHDWHDIQKVDGAGNSSSLVSYSAVDKHPYMGLSYYRLKQTDFDGKFEYSHVRSVNIELTDHSQIEMYPNPTNNNITIVGNENELEDIIICNTLGQNVTLLTQQIENNKTKVIIDLTKLSSGIYYIRTKTTANKLYKQ